MSDFEEAVSNFEAEGNPPPPDEPVTHAEFDYENDVADDTAVIKYVRGGKYTDTESGVTFKRGKAVTVLAADAERLLDLRWGASAGFVRAD